MRSDEWFAVGARLLGVYFLVLCALTVPSALYGWGVATLPGQSKWPFILAPVLQALVAGLVGAWLVRTRYRAPGTGKETDGAAESMTEPLLQLIGVFLLANGLRDLVRHTAQILTIGQDWRIGASDFLGAAGGTMIGLVLVQSADGVARLLRKARGGGA